MPVTTHVISLGSLTVQCRQQVNTPCQRLLRTEALMNVQETFLVLLASTKRNSSAGTRPGRVAVINRRTSRDTATVQPTHAREGAPPHPGQTLR
jgi:hypothetical protein